MPFYGAAILCIDDDAIKSILPQVSRPITSFGLSEDAQIRAFDIEARGPQMRFKVSRSNGITLPDLTVVLNLPGFHNVRNALAAIAVAVELGVPDQAVLEALEQFKGVGRRFQQHGQIGAKGGGDFTLIEDYGHHPAELMVTLAAARGAYPGQRLVLAFQPHRYTRTRDCFEDFVRVLKLADRVILTQVYAAGEKPIVAADAKALVRGLRVSGFEHVIFAETLNDLVEQITNDAQAGDVVMCMGAGSIGQVPLRLVERVQGVAA
jgi:UDP-N-acetylmuramate--alanine ligase